MPTNTNVMQQANGVTNRATGSIVTTSATAANLSINCGFIPRKIIVENVTDRIQDVWYVGMDEQAIYTAIKGITAKLDADAGVTPTDFAATCDPASASVNDLNTSIVALNAKLDASAGVTDTDYTAKWTPAFTNVTTFSAFKTAINGICAKLDADAGVTDTDYAATWATTVQVSLHTVANGTRTLSLTVGILNNMDNTFTLLAATMVASKVFTWEAVA